VHRRTTCSSIGRLTHEWPWRRSPRAPPPPSLSPGPSHLTYGWLPPLRRAIARRARDASVMPAPQRPPPSLLAAGPPQPPTATHARCTPRFRASGRTNRFISFKREGNRFNTALTLTSAVWLLFTFTVPSPWESGRKPISVNSAALLFGHHPRLVGTVLCIQEKLQRKAAEVFRAAGQKGCV
jgi:hypothetical protein